VILKHEPYDIIHTSSHCMMFTELFTV